MNLKHLLNSPFLVPYRKLSRGFVEYFQFVNPGLLGSRKYHDKYIKPIMEGAAGPSARLKRIKPFFLRRLKKQVARLLDRIDKLFMQTLKEEKLYESLYLSSKSQIVEKLNSGGKY